MSESVLDSIESDVSETSDVEKPKLNLREVLKKTPPEPTEAIQNTNSSKFWTYEERKPPQIDSSEFDPNSSNPAKKRRIPLELRNLKDTEEYMDASKAVTGAGVPSERGRRLPRRAAVIARENVNLLRGTTPVELRETRRSFTQDEEKPPPQPKSDQKSSTKDTITELATQDEDVFEVTPAKRTTPPPAKTPSPPAEQRSLYIEIPKPPQLKRRPELISPVKTIPPVLSSNGVKLPALKMKKKSSPSADMMRPVKQDDPEHSKSRPVDETSKPKKAKKEISTSELAELRKKVEENEATFKKTEKNFYDWIHQRAKVPTTEAS